MSQQELVEDVIEGFSFTPDAPECTEEYLPLDEALKIVDETIARIDADQDRTRKTYLLGHRKRLAHSLSLIPKARSSDATCLDVGCYGLMGMWVTRYLGYSKVDGIEWIAADESKQFDRIIELGPDRFSQRVYNFNITDADWPLNETYDTILFLEVLEHVNEDPMGVMDRINRRMKAGGTLVMSVPNSVSYKTFKEFLMGMPPWTYWFYHPDLKHEPRHCFEYTPTVFKTLLKAAGFSERLFRVIYAYSTEEAEEPVIELARSASIPVEFFGDTMISQSEKTSEGVTVRYPDIIYDSDGYYRSSYPAISRRLRAVIDQQHQAKTEKQAAAAAMESANRKLLAAEARIEQEQTATSAMEARLEQANREMQVAEARIKQLLFLCDNYMLRSSRAGAVRQQTQPLSSGAEHLPAHKERELEDLRAHLDAVLSSTSWRITSIPRAIGIWLKERLR